jgi:hypothetical protein
LSWLALAAEMTESKEHQRTSEPTCLQAGLAKRYRRIGHSRDAFEISDRWRVPSVVGFYPLAESRLLIGNIPFED